MLGDQTGTSNDRGSEGRNVEQRPSAGMGIEAEDPTGNAKDPGSEQAIVPSDIDSNAQEGFASDDYASWLGESGQYESEQHDVQ